MEAERTRVPREARRERAGVQQRVQRHVLRREVVGHLPDPPRGQDDHRRRRPAEPRARAVGPDPEARRPEGRRGARDHRGRAAVRGLRLRLPRGRQAGRPGVLDGRLPRQAGPAAAGRPGRAQPGVPAVPVLRAHLPDGRQARPLRPLSLGADVGQAGGHEGPPVRGLHDLRGPRTQGVRRARSRRHREDAGARARGPGAARDHPGGRRRAAADRRAQRRAERLVRRPLDPPGQGHGQGGGVVRAAACHPGLEARPRDRLLAGGLPPRAEEGGGRRARPPRRAPGDRHACSR